MATENSNFEKLLRVAPDLETLAEYVRLSAPGFMDLSIDILYREGSTARISMAHNYKHPSGDLIPDPDMELHVDFGQRKVSARTFQDQILYQETEGDPALQRELDNFLGQWLTNLINQGHRPPEPAEPDPR